MPKVSALMVTKAGVSVTAMIAVGNRKPLRHLLCQGGSALPAGASSPCLTSSCPGLWSVRTRWGVSEVYVQENPAVWSHLHGSVECDRSWVTFPWKSTCKVGILLSCLLSSPQKGQNIFCCPHLGFLLRGSLGEKKNYFIQTAKQLDLTLSM